MSIEDKHRKFLLQSLRAATAQVRLWEAELVEIGTALGEGLIGTDSAVQWARDSGLIKFLRLPEGVGWVAGSTRGKTDQATDVLPQMMAEVDQ
jgi:hypothetical protein